MYVPNSNFQNSEDDIHSEIYERIAKNEEENLFSSHTEMVETLNQYQGTDWGMILEGANSGPILANHCDFYTVGSLATRFYGFVVPKGT